MENKRLTRKLNSFFWWFLMALPLILLVICYVFAIPQYAKNFDWSGGSWSDFIYNILNDSSIYESALNFFDDCSIIHLFDNVLDNFNVREYYFLGYLLNWCLTIYFIHLIFDCVVFIFDWLHDFFERG